ncbi:hypothetical protein LSM04_005395 [Trypanosoma melophagium]|uniref:uncharacterized protein n=1 Tax=Trypanosoma melophagium TaxID=715481 RepID=UPI00351A47B8|nr:hypothetical protein LSM04_005395 [Trypanosoma melophagium]
MKYFGANNTDTADRVQPKVFPKTMHPFIFTVECRKKEKVCDPTLPQDGEQRPTNAAQERDSHETKSAEQPLQGQEHRKSTGGCFAVYVCTSNSNSGTGLDPSEAYNAPGGEKEFHLPLHSTCSHIPFDVKCLPLTLHITMKAHFKEFPLPPLRDCHNMVILVD